MIFKRFVAVLLAACMLLAVGCSEEIKDNNVYQTPNAEDYSKVEGYYTKVANMVEYADGKIAAINYYVCQDEACNEMVGSKRVVFEKDGSVYGYEIIIGVLAIEKMVKFETVTNGTTYSEIEFAPDGQNFKYGKFENIYTNPETGLTTRHTGTQEYYESGVMKAFHEEYYETPKGGSERLVSTTDETYAEDGSLKESKTVTYDEQGNIIQ